jgi:hypothetical protein
MEYGGSVDVLLCSMCITGTTVHSASEGARLALEHNNNNSTHYKMAAGEMILYRSKRMMLSRGGDV